MITCAIDGKEFNTREDLHKHLRKLKVRQEEYYTKYFPRKDLGTGEAIPFRSVEQYLSAEFLSKESLRTWIKNNPVLGKEWSLKWLENRKIEKNLVYPPSQAELRSLICPNRPYYEFIGGYHSICRDLGYKIRYNEPWVEKELPKGAIIIEDTREQKPLNIPGIPTISQKVNTGDYALKYPFDEGVYIERKSLSDLIGTMSDRTIERKSGDDSNYNRFRREVERAAELGHYIVMLVEESYDNALHYNELPKYKFSKILPAHTFKQIRDLLHDFDNFQILFVNGREEASKAVVKLLAAGNSLRNIDLQYEYDCKRLNLS